ncbi:hypothetical protein NDU88_011076 [Pleurodeles waltl]|uniref:Uncharacterized protein n=1 Tax=Pleurodeles waltl TaxID=8319 RepID=A0AAV7QWH6_PLEWA|nr:hypothetical protein NDU88_011076 [Pleurodeles waltl]
MEIQDSFPNLSDNKEIAAFINEAVAKAVSATMNKMSKNIENSVLNMVYKSLMAQSAGDSRKRKNKDLSVQKPSDGAFLTGEASSPTIEDEMPPRPPSQEGNSKNVYGKRKSKTKNVISAPKQVVITHISDTDDDVGDMDDLDDDTDLWGSLSQASPPKKPKLEVSDPFSAKIVMDSENRRGQPAAMTPGRGLQHRLPPGLSCLEGSGVPNVAAQGFVPRILSMTLNENN